MTLTFRRRPGASMPPLGSHLGIMNIRRDSKGFEFSSVRGSMMRLCCGSVQTRVGVHVYVCVCCVCV